MSTLNYNSSIRFLMFVIAIVMLTIGASIAHAGDAPGKSLQQMITTASKATDHQAIAKVYRDKAAHARKDANEHEKAAAFYRQLGMEHTQKRPYAANTPQHCDNVVKDLRAAASDWDAVALEHEDMAAKTK